MSETQSARLWIELNVDCPHCGEFIDILDPNMGMNDEGEMLSKACPSEGQWTDEHKDFSEEVECRVCKETFTVDGIDW